MNPFIENFDKMQFDCSDELKKRFQECKSCQIVGSGPCEHRHLIDQHNLVVKVNREFNNEGRNDIIVIGFLCGGEAQKKQYKIETGMEYLLLAQRTVITDDAYNNFYMLQLQKKHERITIPEYTFKGRSVWLTTGQLQVVLGVKLGAKNIDIFGIGVPGPNIRTGLLYGGNNEIHQYEWEQEMISKMLADRLIMNRF